MSHNHEAKVRGKSLAFEVRRSALLEQIEQNPAQVVAILAPSGYGKTTLARQITQSWRGKVGWIALTEEHADPHTLAGKVLSVCGLLDSTHMTAQAGLSGLAKAVAHQLNAQSETVCLVFDEAQTLTPESSRFLERLVGELEEHHRIILAGYQAEHLPLAVWVSKGVASLWGPHNLAFSNSETESYLTSRNYQGDAHQVQELLEGWPASLALVASGATPGLEPGDLIRHVLGQLPEVYREGIAEAAVAVVWSEEKLRTLGARLKPGWLKVLRQIGLPLAPLGKDTYRPHTLLLEALEEELEAQPERHQHLHRIAAEIEHREGYPLNALQHYKLARAAEEALGLAEELVEGYIQRWQLPLAKRVLDRVKGFSLTPKLQAMQARAMLETKEYVQAEAILRRLMRLDPVPVLAYHGMGMLEAYRGHGREALEWVERGLQLEVSPAEQAAFLSIRAWALSDLGCIAEAQQVLEELAALAHWQGDLLLLGKTLGQLVVVHGVQRNYPASIHAAQQAIKIFDELGWVERTLTIQSNLAFNYLIQGQLDKANELLEHSIPIASREKHMSEALLRSVQGSLWMQYDQPQRALEAFELALQACEGYPIEHTAQEIRLYLCDAARLAGRPDLWQAHLLEARANALEQQAPHLAGLLSFQEGLLALQQGNLEQADSLLVHSQQAHNNPLYPIRALAYRAEIARQQGILTKKHIDELVEQLEGTGNERLLGVDARMLTPLYRGCVHKGWHTRWFAPWLDDVLIHSLIEPKVSLELRLLGKREVLLNGVPIPLTRSRPLELLAFFCLKGSASKEVLMDALFDGSADPGHEGSFRKAVQHLREALNTQPLGFEPVELVGGKYGLSSRLEIHLDALELAEALKREDEVLLQMALESYKGIFCEKAEGEWVIQYRERFEDQVLQVAVKVGGILENRDVEEAIKTYWWALEMDALNSPAYEALEKLYSRLGDSLGLERLRKVRERALSS